MILIADKLERKVSKICSILPDLIICKVVANIEMMISNEIIKILIREIHDKIES
jgi:hypothetical protein